MSETGSPPARSPELQPGTAEDAGRLAHAESLRAWFEGLPFARFLGARCEVLGDEITLCLPFQDKLIGNPMLPALHGGATGAFLELAASAQLFLAAELSQPPKPVDLTIDYLRSGRPKDLFARARVTKLGRRIANVRAEAWQDSRETLIAVLHGHFILSADENERD